ncbi:MAG: hypothetical protein DWQ36_13545 [Acidobacteria bacterium]|nr:MAG: hypothetical protein DWQ30_12005 [Acidobacteriota bacterium]REK06235.1 MAG: hypothetical protein DWQ36_13545 [Acidobacteriota bacterium]
MTRPSSPLPSRSLQALSASARLRGPAATLCVGALSLLLVGAAAAQEIGPRPSLRAVSGSQEAPRTRPIDAMARAKAELRAGAGLQQSTAPLGDVGSAGSGLCVIDTIACGETVQGLLETNDCEFGDGTFVDIYEFEGVAGQTIQVDMNAIDDFLDPYLLLEDPGFNFRAEDDDSGGGLDSRIVFTTDVDGLWAVYANHFEPVAGDPGRYSVTLQCLGAPERPTVLSATTLGSSSIGLDWRDNSNNEDGFEIFFTESGGSFALLGSVGPNTTGVDIVDLDSGVSYDFRVRAFNDSGDSGFSNIATATTEGGGGSTEPCVLGPNTLCLNGGRFEVEVEWEDFEGNDGFGNRANAGTDDSGLFYFFDPTNWEMLVKVIDGCGINGRYWVYSAATTDLGLTLRVRDTDTGQVNRYTNPLGQAAPAITDSSAFATCP